MKDHDVNDLDQLLRDAGARLRATAPTPGETEAARRSLGDAAVSNDAADLGPSGDPRWSGRRRTWILAPAILVAAAAATIGVIVVTRDDEQSLVPAEPPVEDTTAVSEPPATVTPPGTADVEVPVTGAAPGTDAEPSPTSAAATSSTTTPATDLGNGVTVRVSDENYDGAGGRCLALRRGDEEARGCVDGPRLRSGRPVYARLADAVEAVLPGGPDGASAPSLADGGGSAGDDPGGAGGTGTGTGVGGPTPACTDALASPGRIVGTIVCSELGASAVYAALPERPDDAVAWFAAPEWLTDASVPLRRLDSSPHTEPASTTVHAFWTQTTPDDPSCLLVVLVDDAEPGAAPPDRAGSWREACGLTGAGALLAGGSNTPVVVSYDLGGDGGIATVGQDVSARLAPLSSDTAFAAAGCTQLSAADLLGVLPAGATATGLACGGTAGMAMSAGVLLRPGPIDGAITTIERDATGEWSLTDSGTGLECDDPTTALTCTAVGLTSIAEIPSFPTEAAAVAVTAALGDSPSLPSRPATELGAPRSATDVATLTESLVASLRDERGGEGRIDVHSGDASPIVIRATNLDDSVIATIYVVSTVTVELDAGATEVVTAWATAIDVCRGDTTTGTAFPALCP